MLLGSLIKEKETRIDLGVDGGLLCASAEAVDKETIVSADITFVGRQIWFVR